MFELCWHSLGNIIIIGQPEDHQHIRAIRFPFALSFKVKPLLFTIPAMHETARRRFCKSGNTQRDSRGEGRKSPKRIYRGLARRRRRGLLLNSQLALWGIISSNTESFDQTTRLLLRSRRRRWRGTLNLQVLPILLPPFVVSTSSPSLTILPIRQFTIVVVDLSFSSS